MSTEIAVREETLRQMIYAFRGVQVMIDADLASLYGVETKALNQAVKRNINRFPGSFRFQLSKDEKNELVTNCDRFLILDGGTVYHIGASLKDLGKKWFAFSLMDKAALTMMERVEEIMMGDEG